MYCRFYTWMIAHAVSIDCVPTCTSIIVMQQGHCSISKGIVAVSMRTHQKQGISRVSDISIPLKRNLLNGHNAVHLKAKRNKHVIITSKGSFDGMITCLLRWAFVGISFCAARSLWRYSTVNLMCNWRLDFCSQHDGVCRSVDIRSVIM